MKKYLYSLIALWFMALPAYALDGDCDYVAGSTSIATAFTNCGDEIAEAQKRGAVATTSTNIGNAITSTSIPTGTPTVLRQGLQIIVDSPLTISGAATLDYDGTGAKSVTNNANSAVGSGDMVLDTRYLLNYNTAGSGTWMIMNPLGSGFASASPAYVTIGNTASLTGERSLTAGTAIGLTDAGANSTVTVAVNDVELTSIAGVTSAANKIPYYTGSGTAAVADFSAEIRTVITTPSSANFRSWVSDGVGSGAMMFGLATTMDDGLACTASQVVRRNAADNAFECATLSGTGDLLASNNLSDVSSVATAFANIKQAATDAATGVVELATPAEVLTGTSTTLAVTPEGAKRTPGRERCVAASDQTTAITTGTAKVTFPAFSVAWTLTSVYAMVNTAPTGSTIIIDINEDPDAEAGGSASATILSTKLTIDAGERRSSTAAVAAVISDTALGAYAEMTIDFDQVGSSTPGKGVVVCLVGYPT